MREHNMYVHILVQIVCLTLNVFGQGVQGQGGAPIVNQAQPQAPRINPNFPANNNVPPPPAPLAPDGTRHVGGDGAPKPAALPKKQFFNQAPGGKVANKNFRSQGPHLKDMPECKADIAKYCGKLYEQKQNDPSDMDVLECLQDIGEVEGQELTSLCEHTVWKHKINMTRDIRFERACSNFCADELIKYADCQQSKGVPGHLLSCMLDHAEELVKATPCRRFLMRTAKVAFSDFRLVSSFVDKCENVIDKAECGSVPSLDMAPDREHPHSQGTTLECLLERMVDKTMPKLEVSIQCHHELLRLAELRSDDFHLDRPLYFACRADRERFCAKIQAGEGKVFQCLLQNKGDRLMNPECTTKLDERAKLMASNYQLDHPLTNACQDDIRINNCSPQSDDQAPEHWYISYVLLCLENAAHATQPIKAKCKQQMFNHRKLLMSDYHMSPEVVLSCAQDIEQNCKNILQGNGRTLSCLMNTARRNRNAITPNCQQALRTLVKVADPGADVRVDPILYDQCKPLIDGVCKKQVGSELEVMSCLMNHINTPDMDDDCQEHLLEVQYFIARQWGLDPQLYSACHQDATEKCSAGENWHKTDEEGPKPGPLVFHCLYQRMYLQSEERPEGEKPLAKQCKNQIRRVLKERAVSVQLLPALEEPCRVFLGTYCSTKTRPGEELICLQENAEQAKSEDTECYEAITQFTQIQSKDAQLDKLLTRACRPTLQKHCKELTGEAMDNGDVIQCLINNKDDTEMGHKCREYIRHYELILMKNYKFSPRFVEACEPDIKEHCTEFQRDKSNLIRCLSQVHFESVVLGNKEKDISAACRRQLRGDFITREKINAEADIGLWAICKVDIKDKCMKDGIVKSVEFVTECLRVHRKELDPECRRFIFGKQKVEMADPNLDTMLLKTCHEEIGSFCAKVEPEILRKCLRKNRKDPGFGVKCADLLKERMRERAEDIRLAPGLLTACKADIHSECPEEAQLMEGVEMKNEALEGQVIECLRSKLVERDSSKRTKISDNCERELKHIILESEFDFKMDIVFYQACRSTAEKYCPDTIYESKGHGYVVECVKATYYDGKIVDIRCNKEMKRRVAEELTDISLDPVLHDACNEDVKHYCKDTTPGEGRLIECLILASQSTNVKLSHGCRVKLNDRKRLWDAAVKSGGVELPQSLGEVSELILASPNRHSFLTTMFGIILVIFVGGLCFGRCTKKVSAAVKNK